jgi:hypothetical protein
VGNFLYLALAGPGILSPLGELVFGRIQARQLERTSLQFLTVSRSARDQSIAEQMLDEKRESSIILKGSFVGFLRGGLSAAFSIFGGPLSAFPDFYRPNLGSFLCLLLSPLE